MSDPNPSPSAAAFTRFVLPFQWRALPLPGNTPTEGFERIKRGEQDWLTLPPEPEAWAHSYFTHEVRRTLYEEAGWFLLRAIRPESGSGPAPVTRLGKFLVRPAGLVLFEVERSSPEKKSQGLLVLQAEAADSGNPPSLAEWLDFNENFRYVLSPWPRKNEWLVKWFANLESGAPPRGGTEPADRGKVTVKRWLSALQKPVEIASGRWIRLGQSEHMETVPMDLFPQAESRAYVWSALTQPWEDQSALCEPAMLTEDRLPENCGAWVKALNVDASAGGEDLVQASPFERKWAERLTYWRWASAGTLYGFTPHSGVMLTAVDPDPDKSWILTNNINNFKWSHFTMALLVLAIRQRMASLRLSLNEITRRHGTPAGENAGLQKEVAEIMRQMLEFTNLYWFPHVSNQQQALEMYPLMRDAMELEALYRDLRRDIEAAESWLRSLQAEDQTRFQNRFALVGGVGLVLSLAATALQIKGSREENWVLAGCVLVIGAILMVSALWWRVKGWCRDRCEERPGRGDFPQ